MFKTKHRSKATPSPRPRPLGRGRTFLEVISDAAGEKGRLTLTADSGGRSFVVLADNGTLCNVTGAGLAGRDALRAAAVLTDGSYVVESGWPVAQPVYQVGLDVALEELLSGTIQPQPELPQPRGVDTLRNQIMHGEDAIPSASPADPPAPTAAPPMASPQAPPFTQPVGPAFAPLPAPPAPAAAASEPVRVAPTAPRPEPVAIASPVVFERPQPGPIRDAPAGLYPGEVDASRHQGGARHAVTQGLLWLVQVEDEPGRYTLPQAWELTRQSLGAGLRDAAAPVRSLLHREVKTRWDEVKDDWEKSGEVARRSTRKRRPSKHESDDFLK